MIIILINKVTNILSFRDSYTIGLLPIKAYTAHIKYLNVHCCAYQSLPNEIMKL